MRSLFRILLVACLTGSHASAVRANDIQVTNTELVSTGDGLARVHFHINWKNSWWINNGPPDNWDAAWIFVKYRDAVTHLWRHAYLDDGGHGTTQGIIDFQNGLELPGEPFNASTNRTVGVFLRRNANTSGPVTYDADVDLGWDHGAGGIGYADIDTILVFAIEMVYVPQGAFTVGSGGTELGHIYAYPDELSTYQITSESEITVGTMPGDLYYADTLGDLGYHWGDQLGPVFADFPKGFAPFYMMKHEIAQRDYADFLNCLTRPQQARHTGLTNNALLAPGETLITNRYVMSCSTGVTNTRQVIRCCNGEIDPDSAITFYCDKDGDDVGNEDGDGQWVACNYLHWLDLAAYLDWSGLRPMTELEFVKAARGAGQAAEPDGYVWGSTEITQATSISDPWLIHEACGPETANAYFGCTQGPVRTGVFATDVSDRTSSGAGYYGALDLSGNVCEQVVSLGVPLGRAYNGSLGDGELDALGYANAPTWPGNSFLNGAGLLGGSWAVPTSGDLRLSDRHSVAHVPGLSRSAVSGGRGVRDAPMP